MDALDEITVQIPPKRLNAIRQNDCEILREIEKNLQVKAQLDEDGNVKLDGDGGKCWIAQQVITAIALGFEPSKASLLFDDNYFLETIDLEAMFSENQKLIDRYKARIIGSEGRAKKTLEQLTDARVSVWENKITILGTFEDLCDAKQAVIKILQGSTHAGVFGYLEKKRSQDRKTNMLASINLKPRIPETKETQRETVSNENGKTEETKQDEEQEPAQEKPAARLKKIGLPKEKTKKAGKTKAKKE